MKTDVTIYYHYFDQPLPDDKWQAYLHLLPENIQQKITRYRKWEDQHRALFGKILLLKGLKDFGLEDFKLEDLEYNRLQKPILPGNLQFNIAHAGAVIICGFSTNGEIGVDVEPIRPIQLEDYEFIFDAQTFSGLRQARDQEGAFFEAWTIREAILKAEGSGLTEDAKKIKYQNGKAVFKETDWWVYPIGMVGNYVAHLATRNEVGRLARVGF